jgi:hypothetical protein
MHAASSFRSYASHLATWLVGFCLLWLAGAIGALASPASAAAWSRAFKVSWFGSARGAELDNSGVLRVWWEGNYEVPPRLGIDLTTSAGKMTPVKMSALDRYTEKNFGVNPVYEEPASLSDGRWIRCVITVNHPRTRAHIFVLVYSHSGALVKRMLVAS